MASAEPVVPGQVSFRLLGPLEVRQADGPVPIGGRTQRATLGLLLLRANEVVSTRELIDALWPGEPPTTARQILQNAITALRRVLAGGLLTRAPGYVLQVPEGDRDLDEFRAQVAFARARAAAGEWNPAAEALRRALTLWRGPALADLAKDGFTWPELAAIEDEHLCAAEAFFEAELACGRHDHVVREVEAWHRANPRRERLCAQLMLALYRGGRHAEALAAYRRHRHVLVEELGLEPGPSLRSLESAILSHDPVLLTTAPLAMVADSTRVERKRVSLLLVRAVLEDVAGSDVERFGELAHQFAAMVQDELRHFDGTLLWADGSTCSVVFGALRVHEDDPERAVRVALVLRSRLAAAEFAGTVVAMQAAVTSGDALVRHPAREGEPPSVTGPAIDRCRQIVTVLPPGRIHVCEVTRRLAAASFRFGQLPAADRGWEVLDVPTARVEPPTIPPLLERDRALTLLHGVLSRVHRDGRPHLVTVVGEPGIGKTRLLAEFVDVVKSLPQPPRVLLGQTPAFGEGAALAALTGIIAAYAAILPTDPVDVMARKLDDSVRAVASPDQATWLLSHLRPLLGLDAGAGERGRTAEAWRRLLELVAAQQPLVVVVEDLHWADDILLDAVENLLHGTEVPLLVIATTRPDLFQRRPNWRVSGRGGSTLTLARLSDAATNRLIRAVAPNEVRTPTTQALLARVGGIPLFAVEYAKMLRENDVSAQPSTGLPTLPDTVQAVIAARVDALPCQEKYVLQVAAVLSGAVSVDALTALGCGGRHAVQQHLDHLVERGLLAKGTYEAAYTFGHALIQDVAYQQLPRDTRAELHRTAASWLEQLPLPPTDLLAHHYYQAVVLTEAAGRSIDDLVRHAGPALADAGRRAFTLQAFGAAARYYGIALRLCPPDDASYPHLLLGYGKSLIASKGHSDSRFGENILTDARDALLADGHRVAAADAEVALSVERRNHADDVAANDHVQRALRLLRDETTASAYKADVECAVMHSLAVNSNCAEAIDLAGRVLSAGYRFDRPDLLSRARHALGVARIRLGDPVGIADLERAIATCEHHGIATTDIQYNLAWCWADLGELANRGQAVVAAKSAAQRYGNSYTADLLRVHGVFDLYWSGAWDEAVAVADELLGSGLAALPSKPMTRPAAFVHACRGRIRLARGDLAGAITDAERAGELGRGMATAISSQFILALRAQIAIAIGRDGLAAELVERLLGRAGGVCVSPHLGIDLAITLASTGHSEPALAGFAPSPWLRAVRQCLAGDQLGAAETYARIGSVPDQAQARLWAARDLAAEDPVEAARQHTIGSDLAAGMGATRWLDLHAMERPIARPTCTAGRHHQDCAWHGRRPEKIST